MEPRAKPSLPAARGAVMLGWIVVMPALAELLATSQALLGAMSRRSWPRRVGELPLSTQTRCRCPSLMQNLLSNALKFRREGVAPEVSIDSRALDGNVAITVRDNGIGFDQQYRYRIFRAFERLNGRSQYSGTGIGLALCLKIADRHGGGVKADSADGAGSTFTVTIPIARREGVIGVDHAEGNDALVTRAGAHVGA